MPLTHPLTKEELQSLLPLSVTSSNTPRDILTVEELGAANTVTTLTIPAVVGMRHWITHIHIKRTHTTVRAGDAAFNVSTTNFGGRRWRTNSQASITVAPNDTMLLIDADYSYPLNSDVANTNTTISGQALGGTGRWHMQVDYFLSP